MKRVRASVTMVCRRRVLVQVSDFAFTPLHAMATLSKAATDLDWLFGTARFPGLDSKSCTSRTGELSTMITYSLVGYDGSDASRRAFQFAVELARICKGRVRVVSVLQVTEAGADACALLMADSGTSRAQELLDELINLAPDAATLVDVELIHGSPGDVLLSQVEQHGIDHIVIGHTERGALARWLLGSVSSNLLARAHVPVTVVR
jgi:nucleotide-binding universal stress UspA family protein